MGEEWVKLSHGLLHNKCMIDATVWGGRVRIERAAFTMFVLSWRNVVVFRVAKLTSSAIDLRSSTAPTPRVLPFTLKRSCRPQESAYDLQNSSRALNTDAKMLPLATFAPTNGCGVAHKPPELWHCSEERFWSSCFIGRRAARLRLTYSLTRERGTVLLRNWYKSACYKRAICRGREYR